MTNDANLILVVDVDETARDRLACTLRRAGFEVVEAGSAAEAMRQMAERAPRLVLLDVQLPDMDGRELCRRIKSDPATAPVLVLQVSATFVRDEDRVQALESFADAALAVPVEPTVLVATVRASLRSRQAADSLRDALERAELARQAVEEANRAKDEFLATLSHELRSPLGAIVIWATLLRTGQLDAERAGRAIAAIERNARAQAKLVEDLLDMSRIAAGGIRLEISAVSLPAVIEAAIEAVRPAAEEKRITIDVAIDALDEPIAGDFNRLQQAVGNLLANAVKFTPEGGHVDVLVRPEDGAAHIEVRDTGRGIAPDLLPFVFERFRQGDSSSTRREGGVGLGLAIVRHMIELHDGRVEAHSAGLGRGASFHVRLPLRPYAEVPSPTPAADVLERLDGIRVLLVDDEVDAREASRAVLEAAGAGVVTSGSVADALQQLRSGTFDALISDIAMPGEDGYALLARARRLGGPAASVPAIALTAYAGVENQRLARAAGFTRHVAKPVTPADLVGAVATVARRSD